MCLLPPYTFVHFKKSLVTFLKVSLKGSINKGNNFQQVPFGRPKAWI